MELIESSSTISAEQMRLVLDVSRLLAVTPDLATLLTRIAMSATSLLSAERASIFLHDPKTAQLWTRVALGAKEIRVPDSSGIVGHVFHSNTAERVLHPYDDPRFNREIDRRSGFVTRNLLTVPTRDMDRKPIGVLQVVNRLGGDFSDTDLAMIDMLADQAGVAIQRHYLHEEVVRTAGLRHEMELAQKVQVAMTPQCPPQLPGLICVGWTRPASVTGGDCYDLWSMSDGRLGIFLGDASGHGIAPAIVVSQTRTLVRALAELDSDPQLVLTRVNGRLTNDLEPGRFITVFLGCMSSDGELRWVSAGHGPMFLRQAPNEPCQLLSSMAPPIGVVENLNCDPTASVRLEPGGILVVLSDGIYEARNLDGIMWDVEGVQHLLDDHAQLPPPELLALLRQTVLDWQGHDEPADDQTAVIVQYAPQDPQGPA